MAALHSVSNHELLTGPATDYGPERLGEHTLVAESVLGVTRDYTGGPHEDDVLAALALQVSYQGKMEGDKLWHLETSGHGERTREGRSTERGLAPKVNPLAITMIRDVPGVGEAWNVLTGIR